MHMHCAQGLEQVAAHQAISGLAEGRLYHRLDRDLITGLHARPRDWFSRVLHPALQELPAAHGRRAGLSLATIESLDRRGSRRGTVVNKCAHLRVLQRGISPFSFQYSFHTYDVHWLVDCH